MQLVNQTPLVAHADVAELFGSPDRVGVIAAKATYLWDGRGNIDIDTQNPVPLIHVDAPHAFGVIPRDMDPRRNPAFEIMVLGCAHAPQGRSPFTRVDLSVGGTRRSIVVVGNRYWNGKGRNAVMSSPEPFDTIPLAWTHAFGGSEEVYLDAKNHLKVTDPWNPYGKGFDAEAEGEKVAQGFGAAPNFPMIPKYRRALPNLEHPEKLVQRWDDAPDAYCWAPMPVDLPLRLAPIAREKQPDARGDSLAQVDAAQAKMTKEMMTPGGGGELDRMLYRAHPDLIFPKAPGAVPFELTGTNRGGVTTRFTFPAIKVVADYVLGGRTGTLPLAPQTAILFTEEKKMTVLYRAAFSVNVQADQERSFRLRTE